MITILSRCKFMLATIGLCCALTLCYAIGAKAQQVKPWIVYYANNHTSSDFEPYDVIVFDRDNHPPLQNLKSQGKTLLGYVSLGEAEKYRFDYDDIKATHALMEENPNWPEHYAVDVRNPAWAKYVIEEVVPVILHHGFHGIFVDTLDSVEELELRDPVKYKGMIEAAAQLVKAIHTHYPDMKIMINRGYRIMPAIVKDVDYLLGEGTMVNYDFANGKHTFFDDAVIEEYATMMKDLKTRNPKLQIMTLDYWNMSDTQKVKEIYARHRANGFRPYVTTIELDRIDSEPE